MATKGARMPRVSAEGTANKRTRTPRASEEAASSKKRTPRASAEATQSFISATSETGSPQAAPDREPELSQTIVGSESSGDLLEACVLDRENVDTEPEALAPIESIDELLAEDAEARANELSALQPRGSESAPRVPDLPASALPASVFDRRPRRMFARQLREMRDDVEEMVISGTEFGVYSFEDLRAEAVCTVNVPSSEIADNTVNDPRMGPALAQFNCATCHQDIKHCPGHLGMILFNAPILHPLFIDVIIYTLMSIRIGCGGLRLSVSEIAESKVLRMSGINRLKKIAELSASTHCACQKCNAGIIGPASRMEDDLRAGAGKSLNNIEFNMTLSKTQKSVVYKIGKKGVDRIMSVQDVESIFSTLTPDMVKVLGFTDEMHPDNFILRAFPVVPPNVRPPTIEKGEVKDEHLTAMYIDIVKDNNNLANPKITEVQREELLQKFKILISLFIDNSHGTYTQGGNGQPYKSIQQRISGKTELRKNAMGKRVLNTARSVIGPDLKIEWGELVIPRSVARTLSVPVPAFSANIDALRAIVRKGEVNRIRKGSGRMAGEVIEITDHNRDTVAVEIGDTVHRQMRNGDIGIFNRQPTLHKQSMRAYRVVVGDQKTFGVHIADTEAFNADFDGDEMNFHAPQTLEGIAEAITLVSAEACFMNGQSDKPAVGGKLDVITSFYLMTLENLPVEPVLFNDIARMLKNPPDLVSLTRRARRVGLDLHTTRALFSMLLPEDFYYREGSVRIENGILMEGVITKAQAGSSSRSISHMLFKKYGIARASVWITDSTRLSTRWLTENNITTGVAECLPFDIEARDRIVRETIQNAELKIKALGKGPDPLKDPLGAELHERQVRAHLDLHGTIAEKIKDQFSSRNSLLAMGASGAKGNTSNFSQITSLIAQQFLRGNRLLPKTPGGRTLSYYEPEDEDLGAYGFVRNSYLAGVTGPELFNIMMSGREGLVDTANTTSEVGHANHNMAKAMEDLVVAYDGSVRNAQNAIIQPLYGYDGLDSHSLMRTKMPEGETVATFLDFSDMAETLNARARAFEIDLREGTASDEEMRRMAHLVPFLQESSPAEDSESSPKTAKPKQSGHRRAPAASRIAKR